MKTEIITKNNIKIASIISSDIISNAQAAVDLMMTVKFQSDVKNIVIAKELFADRFFVLSSGLAGEILQKFVNYNFCVAIYGDFSKYTSKPLKDFIYESNNGHSVFFADSLDDAVEKILNKATH